jgi:ATP-dependent RNA helicase DeaD
MSAVGCFDAVPLGLASALESRGFTGLTAIQRAVLDPAVVARDLRLSSETGSGKTVAIGLVLADQLAALPPPPRKKRPVAAPRILVIAPTRELAAQLQGELEWLYRPLGARLAVVTGGTSIRRDFAILAGGPHVVVGTPGRLVDHLRRGSLDLSAVETVVLDEADEMLEMGFRDDLELLLESTPEARRTHMVSATFPREVLRLANRYQRDPVTVQGSPAGVPNQDIRHLAFTVAERDRVSALINVLLASPGQRTLVFVRTRASASSLASELGRHGFSVGPLSGEMGQRERTATLEAFRAGTIEILVATDVAARGLDIDDVRQVVHFDLPENGEVFTHRSGRTARAGNKGTSIVLVPPRGRARLEAGFRRLGVEVEWRRAPSPDDIRRAADARLLDELSASEPARSESQELAERLLADHDDPVALVAALLERSGHRGPCDPRHVAEPAHRPAAPAARGARASHRPERRRADSGESFTRFHVTWGRKGGANPNRLVAMVCRRGGIRSHHIGSIKIADASSMIEVSSEIAPAFAAAAQRPDPRDPRVRIRPWRDDNGDAAAPGDGRSAR